MRLRIAYLVAILPLFQQDLLGQVLFSDNVRMTGLLDLSYQRYSLTTTDTLFGLRRPPNVVRARFNATLDAGNNFSMPISVMLSNIQRSPVTAAPTGGNSFTQYLLHPGTRLYIAPTIRNQKFHIGSHVPTYSELSTGTQQIFGAGAEITADKAKFYVNTGNAQRSVAADSASFNPGAYSRHHHSARVEFNPSEGSSIGINLVTTKDNLNSVQGEAIQRAPEQGAILTFDFKAKAGEHLTLVGELGNSAFAANIEADDTIQEKTFASLLLPTSTSFVSGVAGMFKVDYVEETWSLGGSAKWLGKDYELIAHPFSASDRIDVLISPLLRLAKNKLVVRGSVGLRALNVSASGTDEFTTQLLAMVNVFARPSKSFNVSGSFSNFGIRNNVANDTLKIEMVSQSLSLTPTFTKQLGALTHSITAGFSTNAFKDLNTVTGETNDHNTTNLYGLYTLSQKVISASAMYGVMTSKITSGTLNINTLTVSATAHTLKRRLHPTASVVLLTTSSVTLPRNSKQLFRIGFKLDVMKKLDWHVMFSNHHNRYGIAGAAPESTENTIRTSLSYTL